jgi:hypothetical protein
MCLKQRLEDRNDKQVVSTNPLLKLLKICSIAISLGMLFSSSQLGHTSTLTSEREQSRLAIDSSSRSIGQDPNAREQIATLINGNYQFCTEPPPRDWRTGAGVCFYFTKISDRVSGYYGYPYTDDFICVRGKVQNNLVIGEALMISWLGREWTRIPKTALKWDEEGHLLLKDGKISRTTSDKSGRTEWILFGSAKLDARGFYRSNKLPLTSPSRLCKWK